MGKRVPEELIEQVKGSVDIVEVVSEYVQLKKQGRNYFGLCPFHGEKSPSFSVSPDKQFFHCFGCGAGGTSLTFLMDIESISFPEALEILADKAGIDLPENDFIQHDTQRSEEDAELLKAYDLLQKLYHHILVNTKEGKEALAYLNDRGFTDESIRTFQLGYAPNDWNFAVKFLERRGFSLHKMENVGLISKRSSDGEYFDKFRNRVIFPIWDRKGVTIAFGGRTTSGEEPKYLNSPESKLFNKSKTLYSFHLARPQIRKQQHTVLFEGYVDVISAWRAGVNNGVATLGTSLTDDQARMIQRNCETVTICYDSDSAGLKAAIRAADILKRLGSEVKIARMPDGMDPDDYIRTYGEAEFKQNVINNSVTLMTFKLDYYKKGKNLLNEGNRIKYIEEVVKEIAQLDNAVEKDYYLRQIANEYSISLDALKEQEGQISVTKNQTKNDSSIKKVNKPYISYTKKLLPAFHNAERMLLAHMLHDREVSYQMEEEIGVSFNIDEHNAIAILLYAFYEEGNDENISQFIERVHDQTLKGIVSELAMLNINKHLSEKELSDYIKQVLNYPKWLKIREIEMKKQEADKQQDFTTAAQLAMDIIKMKKELNES